MMTPPKTDETLELIEHLRRRRLRRIWKHLLLIGLGTAVVLGAVIVGVVLATTGPGDGPPGSPSSSLAGATTEKATTTMTTIGEPVTSETSTTTVTPSTAHPDTTVGPTSTSAASTATTTNWLAGKVISIDPGHQAHADSSREPVGPGSKTTKDKVSSGTASVLTGIPESAVTLQVGLKLRDALEALGVKVVMTRTTQDVDVPNSARAQIANNAHADLAVRLHCNGSTNHSVHGLFTLYPASMKGWTDDIAAVSKQAAVIVQRDLIAATGAQDRGLEERSDLTGFNWSDVPVVLVEMGFMTNPTEDAQLRSGAYQDKVVQGFVQGIIDFLRTQ